jgi:hypothetical protein
MAVRENPYEKQARFSVILGAIGAASTLAAAFFMLQAFRPAELQIVYDPTTLRMPAIGGSLAVGLIGGGAAFLLGLQSAGQKTNKRNQLSWTGFFLGAGVITLALCCGVVFFFWRFPFHPTNLGAGG